MPENITVSRKAMIVGASGLVGGFCLSELLKLNLYSKIHVLLRREISFDLSPEDKDKVVFHVIDFDKLNGFINTETEVSIEGEKQSELFRVDDVFCCLGTTLKQAGSKAAFKKVDYDYCLTIAKLSKAFDIQHFLLVSAVNAKANSPFFYSQVKGELESALIALQLKRLSIFQPSLLLGKRQEFRLGESAVGKMAKLFNFFIPERLSRIKAIEAQVVGHSMAKHAQQIILHNEGDYVQHLCYKHMQSLLEN